MKASLLFLFSVVLSFLVTACAKRQVDYGPVGVAMTFDDRASIESWGEAREFLREQGIRATFFVDRPYAFSDRHLEILRQLVADGHEIGSHGFRHQKVSAFKVDDQMDAHKYYEEEVRPSLEKMSELGFPSRSFAYPHGRSHPDVDTLILEQVGILRVIDNHKAKYTGPRKGGVIGAMTLDRKWYGEEINNLLEEMKTINGVLVLAGHKITDDRGYCMSARQDIETIAAAVRKHQLAFVTMSELAAERNIPSSTAE